MWGVRVGVAVEGCGGGGVRGWGGRVYFGLGVAGIKHYCQKAKTETATYCSVYDT